VEDIVLMRQTLGGVAQVKAAGGIRTRAECIAMLEAGAERIGTSSSLDIMTEH
jgi:deoxyribose-phosphate aldolase